MYYNSFDTSVYEVQDVQHTEDFRRIFIDQMTIEEINQKLNETKQNDFIFKKPKIKAKFADSYTDQFKFETVKEDNLFKKDNFSVVELKNDSGLNISANDRHLETEPVLDVIRDPVFSNSKNISLEILSPTNNGSVIGAQNSTEDKYFGIGSPEIDFVLINNKRYYKKDYTPEKLRNMILKNDYRDRFILPHTNAKILKTLDYSKYKFKVCMFFFSFLINCFILHVKFQFHQNGIIIYIVLM